ncbi:MAG TPA: NTP transferase domain-containing protein [Aldersonia sp.]
MRAEAIVLAGGRASRMGGVDKPALVVGGRSMLATVLAALDWCETVAVVGPHRDSLPADVMQTREHPPGAGPVAAVSAGIAALPGNADLVAVVAADLPLLRSDVVRELARECTDSGVPVAFAVDDAGRVQYLVGVWRHDVLARQLAALGSTANRRMQDLVPDGATTVTLDGILDADTPADLARIAPSAATGLDEARESLRRSLTPLPAHDLAVADALGAVLAAPMVANEPLPRVDVSAMDGYAVAGAPPWRLRADVGYAGGARPDGLHPGEAVRIATGAHLPDGAVAVLRDERARVVTDATLDADRDVAPGTDIRRSGEDWSSGIRLADAGTPVTPALVSLAASADVAIVAARGPVRARVVVTGDEIRRDGPLRPGQTRDSIGPVLPIFLAHNGIRTVDTAHLRDTASGFDEVLRALTDADLLVVVGATGGGAADQLRAALRRVDATVVVARLDCRPGGSTVVAALPDSRVVLGLPGNPYAAIASLSVLSPALIDALTGRTPRVADRVPLRNAGAIATDRTRVAPAARTTEGWLATDAVRTAHLGGLVDADAFAIVPPGARDGDLVELVGIPR